jgi:hypothetical protein
MHLANSEHAAVSFSGDPGAVQPRRGHRHMTNNYAPKWSIDQFTFTQFDPNEGESSECQQAEIADKRWPPGTVGQQ